MTPTIDQAIVIRAWRDEEYRAGLPHDVRAALPAPPAGSDRMTDAQLDAAAGAMNPVVKGIAASAATVGSISAAMSSVGRAAIRATDEQPGGNG